MDIETLRAQADKDLKFDTAKLGDHAIELSSSRDRWSRWAMDYQLKIYRIESEMKILYGKVHRQVMSDVDLKIDRRDADSYVEADDDYRKLADKHAILKATLKYIDSVMAGLERASYNIGNSIKWEMWKSGAN